MQNRRASGYRGAREMKRLFLALCFAFVGGLGAFLNERYIWHHSFKLACVVGSNCFIALAVVTIGAVTILFPKNP
jgi:diacylglycerol kinase